MISNPGFDVEASLTHKQVQAQSNTDTVSITAGEFTQRFTDPITRAMALNTGLLAVTDQFTERYNTWRTQQEEEMIGPIQSLIKAIRRHTRHNRFLLLRMQMKAMVKGVCHPRKWWQLRGRVEVVPDLEKQDLLAKAFVKGEVVLRTSTRELARGVIHNESQGGRRWYVQYCNSETDSSIIYLSDLPKHLRFDQLGLSDRFKEMRHVEVIQDMNLNFHEGPRELLYRLARALEVAKALSDSVVLCCPVSAMEAFLDLEARVCVPLIHGMLWRKNQALTFSSEPLEIPAGVEKLIDYSTLKLTS